jgi:hypothetical protein
MIRHRQPTRARERVTVLAVGLLAAGSFAPASAAGWNDVDSSEQIEAVNPCTGQLTTLTLEVEQLHLTGGASGNLGIHFRGTYTADDGASGWFRDTDQEVVLDGDDVVFTERVQFVGTYEGRRQISHFVLHVTVTAGELRVVQVRSGSECSGASPRR